MKTEKYPRYNTPKNKQYMSIPTNNLVGCNSTYKTKQLQQGAAEVILHANRLDEEIYQVGVSLFEAQLKQVTAIPKEEETTTPKS